MTKMAQILELTSKAAIACLVLFSITILGAYPNNRASAQGKFDMTSLTTVAQGQLPMTSTGVQILPVVSTGSVNINSCDMPFIRSNGGSGAFPSAGGAGGADPTSGGGSGPNQGMPDLPPGYIGVQNSHNGGYMGAVPPGGNIVDFFKGAYGLAPGEEAEANYILNNQLYQLWQSGEYAGLWGPYEQSGPPGGGN